MSPSTKDKLHISKDQFQILRKIVKKLPADDQEADLAQATVCYLEVLSELGLDANSDKTYYGALICLNQYAGLTWREKLLNAAAQIEADDKASSIRNGKSHARSHSVVSAPSRPSHRDASSRSVIQQKLDRGIHPSERSHELRRPLPDPSHEQDEPIPVLTQEQKSNLVQRFQRWQLYQARKRLDKCFVRWSQRLFALRKRRREQLDFAIREDHRTLKVQTIDIWYGAYLASVEFHKREARKADLFYLRKTYNKWVNSVIERRESRYFAQREAERAKIEAEREILRDALISKFRKKLLFRCIKSWRQALDHVAQLKDYSIARHKANLHKHAWKQWLDRIRERSATQRYHAGLKRRTFQLWLKWTGRIAESGRKADELRAQNLISNAFDSWCVQYAARDAACWKARTLDYKKLCRNSLMKWRQAYELACKHDTVQASVEKRILSISFSHWRKGIQSLQETRQIGDACRLQVIFQSWRRKAQAISTWKKSQQASRPRLLHEVLQKWLISSRGRMHTKVLLRRSLSSTLDFWRASAAYRQGISEAAFDESESRANDRRKKHALEFWKGRTCKQIELTRKASEIYNNTITLSAFCSWREAFAGQQYQTQRARNVETRFSNKRVLRLWRAAWLQRKDDRLQERLETRLEKKDSAIVKSSFHSWLRQAVFHVAQGQKADEFRRPRDEALKRDTFAIMKNRHMDNFECRRKAQDYRARSAATLMISALLARYRSRCEANQLSNDLWRRKETVMGRRHLEIWRTKLEDIRTRSTIALFAARHARLKPIFRKLRAYLRSKYRSDQQMMGDSSQIDGADASTSGINTSSMEISRTRVRWTDEESKTLVSDSGQFLLS